jgi:hypothetical protein
MVRVFRYSAAALFLALAVVASASAQGYEGVLAPAEDAPAAQDGGVSDGYSGVIAPSVSGAQESGAAEPGYPGLVPGYVDSGEAEVAAPAAALPATGARPSTGKSYPGNFTPARRTPQMSSQYAAVDQKIRSAQDLQTLAMIYSFDKNADGIADSMAEKFRLSKDVTKVLEQPRPRVNGMLPMESMIKDSIDAALKDVRNKRQNPEEIVKNLRQMRDGLRAKRSVPDSVYKVMGMPETYVKEEREGIDRALSRIDGAIRQLGG